MGEPGINMAFTGLSRTAPFASSGAQKLIVCPRGSTVAHAAELAGKLKLYVEAGKANPSPPVGPMLGSRGINIMAFCKEYNALTADKIGSVIPVEITLYEDKSFSIKLKTSPASILIKKASGIVKGSSNPKQQLVGSLSKEQVKEIAVSKIVDLNCTSTESAIRTVLGTCEGMGVKVDA